MISWLTWRLGAIGLALALAAAIADDVAKRLEIRSLNRVIAMQLASLEQSSRDLGACQANVTTIGASLDRQSADIRALAQASADAGARAADAAKRTEAASVAAKASADRVLALPRPAPAMACQEAERLLRGAL